MYDETETPIEGACLRYMMNRNRQMMRRERHMDVFKISETE